MTVLLAALAAALLAGAATPAVEGPRPSDETPPEILAACDARAAPFGRFDPAIAEAAAALVDLGVFDESEFFGLAIGWCGLVAVGGPVATTSCAADTILLDEKYRREGEAFPLAATLAHEMKHYLQHTDQKARHGAGWCGGADYPAARAAMEAEADAFGDAVAALLYLGREIEIRNECAAPLEIWIEADRPRRAGLAPGALMEVAPGAAALAPFRAAAGDVRFYARTGGATSPAAEWAGGARAPRRRVAGETVRLRWEKLKAQSRAAGPFQLEFRCG